MQISKKILKISLIILILALAGSAAFAFKYRKDLKGSWGNFSKDVASFFSRERKTENTAAEGYNVLAVFDGDTIAVEIGGKPVIVQAIGINAPEAGSPGQPVECYAAYSTALASQLLSGKKVELKTDDAFPAEDPFGRLFRYLILPDGKNYNEVMLEQGAAYEYSEYPGSPYGLQAEFRQAEGAARASGKGLWAPDSCSGARANPAGADRAGSPASDNSSRSSGTNAPSRPR